jgi:hypothetical protein
MKALILASVIFVALASPQSNADTLLRDCMGRVATTRSDCEFNACQCRRWQIDLYRTDNFSRHVWGQVEAKSRDEVVAEWRHRTNFEKVYARLFKTQYDNSYEDASGPICNTCSPDEEARKLEPQDAAAHDSARKVLKSWERRIRTATGTVVRGGKGLARSPYEGIGDSAKEYIDNVHRAAQYTDMIHAAMQPAVTNGLYNLKLLAEYFDASSLQAENASTSVTGRDRALVSFAPPAPEEPPTAKPPPSFPRPEWRPRRCAKYADGTEYCGQ